MMVTVDNQSAGSFKCIINWFSRIAFKLINPSTKLIYRDIQKQYIKLNNTLNYIHCKVGLESTNLLQHPSHMT